MVSFQWLVVYEKITPAQMLEKKIKLDSSIQKKSKQKKVKVRDNFESFGMSKEDQGPVSGAINNSRDSSSDNQSDNGTVFEEEDEENFKLINHDEVQKILSRFYDLKLQYVVLYGSNLYIFDNPPMNFIKQCQLGEYVSNQYYEEDMNMQVLWSKNGL